MIRIIAIPFIVCSAFLIATVVGRRKQIGFGWSLFMCLFLGPVVGGIVTASSRDYFLEDPAPSPLKKVLGWSIIVYVTSVVVSSIFHIFPFLVIVYPSIEVYIASVGLIGLGCYLIALGDGKNFNP